MKEFKIISIVLSCLAFGLGGFAVYFAYSTLWSQGVFARDFHSGFISLAPIFAISFGVWFLFLAIRGKPHRERRLPLAFALICEGAVWLVFGLAFPFLFHHNGAVSALGYAFLFFFVVEVFLAIPRYFYGYRVSGARGKAIAQCVCYGFGLALLRALMLALWYLVHYSVFPADWNRASAWTTVSFYSWIAATSLLIAFFVYRYGGLFLSKDGE